MNSTIQPDEIDSATQSLADEFELLEESQKRQTQATDASLKVWIILKLEEFFMSIGKIVGYPNQLLDDAADSILERLRSE